MPLRLQMSFPCSQFPRLLAADVAVTILLTMLATSVGGIICSLPIRIFGVVTFGRPEYAGWFKQVRVGKECGVLTKSSCKLSSRMLNAAKGRRLRVSRWPPERGSANSYRNPANSQQLRPVSQSVSPASRGWLHGWLLVGT